jgi:hypothetical protein
MSIREEYDALLESGDLRMLFPRASGKWETDEKRFTMIYQANQAMLKGYDNETGKKGSSDLV